MFRLRFKKAVGEVKEEWQRVYGDNRPLHIETETTRLVLYPSALGIAPARQSRRDGEAQAILAARQFDAATIKKARQIAGQWNVNFLAEQYFAWIDQKQITPKDPRAHFYNFITAHRRNNGEAV